MHVDGRLVDPLVVDSGSSLSLRWISKPGAFNITWACWPTGRATRAKGRAAVTAAAMIGLPDAREKLRGLVVAAASWTAHGGVAVREQSDVGAAAVTVVVGHHGRRGQLKGQDSIVFGSFRVRPSFER